MELSSLTNDSVVWKVDTKLNLKELAKRVLLLEESAQKNELGNFMQIEPKVQSMGKYVSYWEKYWAGSDAVTSPNVRAYFNESKEICLFEAGFTKTYYFKGKYDYQLGYSVDFVKQLKELFSLNLVLQE